MVAGFTRLPLGTQFRLLSTAVVLVGAATAMLLLGRVYIVNAQSRARATADLVEDVGAWASRYRGLWVRRDAGDTAGIGESLATIPVFSPDTMPHDRSEPRGPWRADLPETDIKTLDGSSGGFHLKNPELIQRELSELAAAAGQAVRFRFASDKFMRPSSAPTRFELAAIEGMRESGGTEAVEIKGNTLLYARRLDVSPACMACHDTPARAPLAVRMRYPEAEHGYGYKLGELMGVISVSVPIVEPGGSPFGAIGVVAWVGIGAFVASVVAFLWFVQSVVIAPVQRLSRAAAHLSESDIADIHPTALRFTHEGSRNDIHRLDLAVKRLLRSLKVQSKY